MNQGSPLLDAVDGKPGQSRFPSFQQVLVPNFSGYGASAYRLLDFGAQEFEAVSIGPQSQIDSCYLFLDGAEIPATRAGTGAGAVENELFTVNGRIIKIGVGSPFIGRLSGKMQAVPIMARSAYNAIRHYVSNSTYPYPSALELIFHKRAPFYFPDKRPDDTYSQYDPDITGTAAIASFLKVPGMGRKEQIFSWSVSGTFTSGTLTVSIYGHRFTGFLSGGILHSSLLEAVSVTAIGDTVYEYEGKFDFYEIKLTKASIVGTNLKFDAAVKVSD